MKEPSQRIRDLGSRLVGAMGQEDDPAVMLSALAFAVAVVCAEAAERRPGRARRLRPVHLDVQDRRSASKGD